MSPPATGDGGLGDVIAHYFDQKWMVVKSIITWLVMSHWIFC